MNTKYKLVAIDADGTLLTQDNRITKQNRDAIQAATEKGVRIVLCSGRSYRSLRLFAAEIGLNTSGNYVVAFNGGMIVNAFTNEVVYETRIDMDLAKELVATAKPFSPAAATIVYRDTDHILIKPGIPITDIYATKVKTIPVPVDDISAAITEDVQKVLLAGLWDDLQEPAKLFMSKFSNRCNMSFSGDYLFECNELNTTKGSGLAVLCNRLDITLDEVIAIGDHENDLSMIETAGLGVCMANGEESVKRAAGYVTENDCENSGVAEVLHKFILQ